MGTLISQEIFCEAQLLSAKPCSFLFCYFYPSILIPFFSITFVLCTLKSCSFPSFPFQPLKNQCISCNLCLLCAEDDENLRFSPSPLKAISDLSSARTRERSPSAPGNLLFFLSLIHAQTLPTSSSALPPCPSHKKALVRSPAWTPELATLGCRINLPN